LATNQNTVSFKFCGDRGASLSDNAPSARRGLCFATANLARSVEQSSEERTDWRSEVNSNRQFRFSNNQTTAGCLVRQRFDEPALLGVTEGPPGRSSRCSETITESCRPEVLEPGLAVRIHFAPPPSPSVFPLIGESLEKRACVRFTHARGPREVTIRFARTVHLAIDHLRSSRMVGGPSRSHRILMNLLEGLS
jgi:hypothetical protein